MDRSLRKYKKIEINWIQFVFNQFYILVSNIFHLIVWFENKSNFKRIFLVIDSAISADLGHTRCRICMCWTNFYFAVPWKKIKTLINSQVFKSYDRLGESEIFQLRHPTLHEFLSIFDKIQCVNPEWLFHQNNSIKTWVMHETIFI